MYDHFSAWRFAFLPLWVIPVVLIYAPRRADCPRFGITVEMVPWTEGEHHLTRDFAVFLARWARRLGWREGHHVGFCSLRYTFGISLAKAGVAPRLAMVLVRHSDINLTVRLYSHTALADRAEALATVPSLTIKAANHVATTATEPSLDEIVFLLFFPKTTVKHGF